MIYSMTGYGKAETTLKRGTLHLELRSVNSKNIDLNFQIPSYLRGMEPTIRKTITQFLGRGKVDCRVYFENEPSSSSHELNYPLIKRYHSELKKAAKELGIQSEIEMGQLLRLPDIFVKEGPVTLNAADERKVHMTLKKALKEMVRFRKQEGAVLEEDMMKRIGVILKTVKLIEPYDRKRLIKIRARFTKQFKQVNKEGALDKNRFEQELIYYIEKLDLTEEKVRLQAHCDYFKKTARSQDGAGKKLGFIAQEIGREINTIGSKANDANIQRLIVGSKDELEKIKEQLFNVL